ncbi:universal stress protein [Pseudonocardia humida]|uniref:Universal stress protein n=1 Tax=Pseudonocardia humida TaxID=2800819 RepID=A0ABT0ZY12_9PSEU|nr:universal stress protein [Pseudonocardia humida]MCO1655606.1 universal stress protein [Pseudonocardia humida]
MLSDHERLDDGPSDGRAPVVVGVDGAGSAATAVDWAAAEAAARGCPLRLVHAFHPPPPGDLYGVATAFDGPLEARDAARAVLAEAASRARAVTSETVVSMVPRHGTPAGVLLAESAGAQLLVLGTRGRSGLRGLLGMSVSARVSAGASCPVVVVHPARRDDDPSPAPARVVVGIDATTSCAPAVGVAFRAARQRGVPLVAVHAWAADPPADLEAVAGCSTVAAAMARKAVDRALERWTAEFPDVAVHTLLVRGDPARALLAASRGAALVVVGSSGRERVRATLGPVSRAVLQHSRGAVAVVRPDGARSTPRPAGLGDDLGRRGSWRHRRSPGADGPRR